MLNKKEILDKMLSHFGKWMDIRRKPSSSTGGKLIKAINEEIEPLQEAIDEYVNFHFLDSNMKNLDYFISHVYSVQIGAKDISSIELISPNLKIVDNLDQFYKQKNLAYYQDGFLFVRMENVKEDIKYTYEGYLTIATPTIKHIWNIFDEFAIFVGLERYDLESNASLVKRIILSRREKINSTGEGLQYAIYSALATLDETLLTDEIKIELPSDLNTNLLTPEGNTIIDEMAQINRDMYRYKRWDIDNWNHDLNSSSFLPHQWDYPIDYFKNGIGDNEDLKTYLLSRNEYVSATINMYQKDQESMISYINNNDIKENVTISLVKPLDTINPITALYKITANNLIDITQHNLGLKYNSIVNIDKYIQTPDIVDLSKKDEKQFEFNDKRILTPGRKYQINIQPRFSYGNASIEQCKIENSITHTVTNLLQENGGFRFNNDGVLANPDLIFFGCKTMDFDTAINVIDTPKGLTISNQAKIATLVKNLENCAYKTLQIETFCELTDVKKEFITAIGFDKVNEIYKNNVWNSSMTIELKANYISANIDGNALVKIYKDNTLLSTYFTNGLETITTPNLQSPVSYKIAITPVSQVSQISVSNIKYTSYEVIYKTQYGKPFFGDGVLLMPAQNSNTLSISLITNTNYSPVLLGVHVGTPNIDLSFNTDIFLAKEGDMLLINNDFSIITLSEYDSNNNLLKTQVDYIPTIFIKSITDNSVLELNLENYTDIETVDASDTVYKVLKVDGITRHYLYFKRNCEISSIYVRGYKKTNETLIYFNELLNINIQNNDKLYISNAYEGLITLKNNLLSLIKLNEYPSLKHIFSNGSFEVINYVLPTNDFTLPNTPFNCIFSKMQDDGNTIKIINSNASGRITNLYFNVKNNLTFIAQNKFISYKKEEIDVPIVNTFYPFINENELYLYKVEPVSDNVKVGFYELGLPFDETRCFSIGNKTLHLYTQFNIDNENSINSEKKYLTKPVNLYHTIELSNYNTDDEGNYIDLKEYLIKPPNGMEVFYYEVADEDYMIHSEAFYTQKMTIEEDGFNKLKYCHVNKINSIKLNASNGVLLENGYELIKEIGIVKWNEDLLKAYKGQVVYISYKIDLPLLLQVSDDIIYKSIEKIEKAHKLIKTLPVSFNINNSDSIDLSNNQYYVKADFVTINFDVPGYVADFKSDHIQIKKINDTSEIAIHSGYYYFDGKEHYLFSNATTNDVKNIGYATLSNVDKVDNHILTYSYNENYVRNSKLNVESFGEVYNNYFTNYNSDNDGVSYLNYISACDSFSKWINVGMNLKLAKGLNDQALLFSNLYEDSYSMLDITSIIHDRDYVTCYINGDLDFFIGSEPKYENTTIKHVYHIDELIKIQPSYNLIAKNVKVDPKRNYYVIIKGSGILDDLIICDSIKYQSCKNIHTKNIDYANLLIGEESNELEKTNRFAFTEQLNKNYSAIIDERGYVVNASNIDWTLTKFKQYETPDDWKKCELKNISIYKDLVKTNANEGILITEDIYIGDTNFINKIIVKVNDVIFNQMDGIELEILGTKIFSGNYMSLYKTSYNNATLYNVMPFVKIKLTMPPDKIVKNISIYIDYKSDGELKIRENSSGYYLSQLFDMQTNNDITLTTIDIEDTINNENVQIYIRGAKEDFNNEIFSSWEQVFIEEGAIVNNIRFENTRYFQFKIVLNNKNASIKINYFEIRVG